MDLNTSRQRTAISVLDPYGLIITDSQIADEYSLAGVVSISATNSGVAVRSCLASSGSKLCERRSKKDEIDAI